jgi:chromate reductase
MSTTPRILAFAGSARRESLNRKLLAAVVEEVRTAGGEVTLLDLNDYPLPLYHGDEEDRHGLPSGAQALIELITGHPALLIATPEYNSMFTPLLKNTIDWCTRGDDNPFVGRVAAVVSASPGQFGGIRSMTVLRQLLTHLGCLVIPAQCVLPRADQALDDAGRLREERARKAARAVAEQLVRMTSIL